MTKHFFSFTVFCIAFTFTLTGQQKVVKGTVKNINNEPIIGATVYVKNTDRGTITDINGKYVIEVSKGDSLVFSYVGYASTILRVIGSTVQDVVLQEDNQLLAEVVAVGYGVQKKVNLIGAVDQVKGDALAQIPSNSSATALQGKLSGVFINSPSGTPGGDSKTQILIRGIGTLNDASPLILIDGLESSVDNFLSINVNDIESVSVLKDASSSAIYGNRAANGVLLVTTKKGDKNKTLVSYSGNFGIQNAINLPKLMNSWEFLEWSNKGQIKHNKPLVATEETIAKYRTGENPYLYPNYQPYEVFLRQAHETTHNLSARGSQGFLTFYSSLGYKSQEGVEINNSYEQINFRINLEGKFLNERLHLGIIQTYNVADSDLPPTNININTGRMNKSSMLGLAVKQSPKSKVINPDGSFAEQNYALYFSGGYVQNHKIQNYTKLWSTYKISDNSSLILDYAFSNTQNDNIGVIPEYSIVTNFENSPKTELFDSRLVKYRSNQDYSNINLLLNNDFQLEKHSLKSLLGFSAENWDEIWESINGSKLVDASIPSINNITGDIILDSFIFSKAMLSTFGRVNYNYDERYLAEATVRLDGSSTFQEGHRWGVFPSFSLGWRVSEEQFLKGNNILRNLKVRASYGQLGNDKVPVYSVYNTISSSAYYSFNNTAVSGAKVEEVGNKTLTWEKTTDMNAGIDLQIFKNLFITLDLFDKRTTNILQKTTAPALFGYNGMGTIANMASMQNQGFEATIEHINTISDFKYGLKLNLSYVKNKVTDLFFDTSGNDYLETNKGWNIIKKGEAFNSLYGYEVAGIIPTKEDADKFKDIFVGSKPSEGYAITGIETYGDWYYVDRNNDGKINESDKTILGSPFPSWQSSANISFGYKTIEMGLFFQGIFGNKIFSNGTMVDPYMGGSAKVADLINIWTFDNPSSSIPWSDGMKSKTTPNSYYVEDASYLRLKNIVLSYSVPKKFLAKKVIKECKLSISATNIFTWTNYRYFDPETALNSTNNDFNYPQTRVWNLGLKVSF